MVVQGPVGDNPRLCWGDVRLTELDAKKLSVEILEVNPSYVGVPWQVRRGMVYEMLIEHMSHQPEDYAWVLEADVLPMLDLNAQDVLANNYVAGRFSGNWTWFVFNTKHAVHPFYCENYTEHSAYGCKINRWPEDIVQPKNYTDKDHFEWCEPGFFHIDRITLGLSDKKLLMVEEILGEPLGPPACKKITNLPHIKFKPSLNIPRKTQMNKTTLRNNIDSYEEELKRWEEAGKPVRSKEQMEKIFNTFCKHCSYYTGEKCHICGCMINLTTGLNKLRWATTRCPDNPPRWTEDIPVAEEKEAIIEQKEEGEPAPKQADPPPDAAPTKRKKKGCGC